MKETKHIKPMTVDERFVNLETMISSLVASQIGHMKLLKKLIDSQKETNESIKNCDNSIKKQNKDLDTLTETLNSTNTKIDEFNKIIEQIKKIETKVEILNNNLTTFTKTEMPVFKETLIRIAQGIDDNNEEIIRELQPIDYTETLKTMIETMSEMQSNFESCTTSVENSIKEVKIINNEFDKLNRTSELFASRLSSVDAKISGIYLPQTDQSTEDMQKELENLTKLAEGEY